MTVSTQQLRPITPREDSPDTSDTSENHDCLVYMKGQLYGQ
jgi:hypothetical protein